VLVEAVLALATSRLARLLRSSSAASLGATPALGAALAPRLACSLASSSSSSSRRRRNPTRYTWQQPLLLLLLVEALPWLRNTHTCTCDLLLLLLPVLAWTQLQWRSCRQLLLLLASGQACAYMLLRGCLTSTTTSSTSSISRH
jgi:hypothetical protein